ncbi:MAG: pyridoxamine 5'-phosphate oxidase family protein [Desulfobacula sp.]|uniref:pyridoxamine 5'-phosphate oxidase family protein n=1 Tax=Desulfobacula sp. TaxID=2593537 RepID=UPI0025BE52E8|nr:pyridoxamine 5'-phosphate oxidase family protein [Desulfobacula sp.]MCD4720247.1 pyridoxamine 5'-phosphate oxidase family protein [Desulfobacula sp.]
MRKKEKEITDIKEIEKILQESNVCRLAMVDGDKPYMVPMNFGYQDGHLFFHSAKQGRKIDLIQKNPNVCFEVDQLIKFKKAKLACEWGVEYKSVIGSGRAQLLENLDEKIAALNIIMSQYSDRIFEYPDETLEKTAVIKVQIDNMTGKQS